LKPFGLRKLTIGIQLRIVSDGHIIFNKNENEKSPHEYKRKNSLLKLKSMKESIEAK